ADFDFTVRWIPGNTNVIADALSRVNDNDTILEENARSDMQIDPVGSKLTEVKMEGGGDSLVKCFSLWLHGHENEHLAIRECIVKELFENQKKYGLELNKAEKFKLRILKQAGMLLIPEAVAAFANLYKCEVEHDANINTVPLFLRGADKSNNLVNNKIIPLFLREPGKPGKVINTVNMQSNEIPLTLANVALNNKLTKIIYGLNFSPISPPSPDINLGEGGSPNAAEEDSSDDIEVDASIRAEFQFLGRGGPPEVETTPPPSPTKCAPETGARSKGAGSKRGEQPKLSKNLHTPKVAVPPGEFCTSTPGVDEPRNTVLPMPDLAENVKIPSDLMREFDPNEEDAFISSEEEESFPGFVRFGPSAEMVLDRLESMLEDPVSQDANNFSLKRTLTEPTNESSIPPSLRRNLTTIVDKDIIVQPETIVTPETSELLIPKEEAPSAPQPRRTGLRNLPDKGEGFYKV
ncbi:unnamed protein product, partial [Rotaria magnacalcarata]